MARQKWLQIRMDEAEKEEVRKAAARRKQDMSEFVRSILLREARRKPRKR